MGFPAKWWALNPYQVLKWTQNNNNKQRNLLNDKHGRKQRQCNHTEGLTRAETRRKKCFALSRESEGLLEEAVRQHNRWLRLEQAGKGHGRSAWGNRKSKGRGLPQERKHTHTPLSFFFAVCRRIWADFPGNNVSSGRVIQSRCILRSLWQEYETEKTNVWRKAVSWEVTAIT